MKRPVCTLVLSVSLISALLAQLPHFQPYYPLRKNEAVHVNAIFQDKAGFMWFGSNKGLFRFNGKSFQRFTTADSLPANDVTAIAQDSAGRIWIGHRTGELAFCENGIIRRFEPREGSATAPVSSIVFDRRGRLWFSTMNDGLYYFTNDRLYRLDDDEGMPDLFVYDLAEDAEGNIWAGTDRGIAICSLNGPRARIEVLDNEDGLPDNIVKRLVFDGKGSLYLATEDAGVLRYSSEAKEFQPLIKGEWAYGSVSDFLLKANNLWIATNGSGLVLVDGDEGNVRDYHAHADYALQPITCMFEDREGNVWAGTRTGIVRTSGNGLRFIDSLPGAGAGDVVALAVDKDFSIWFSNSAGLFKRSIDRNGKVVIRKQLSAAFERYNIISLFIDPAGFIWAGLYGEGVLRIDPATGNVRHLSRELRNGNVLHITGRGNEVWLATLGGGERIVTDGDRFHITHFSRENGLSSDFIYQVFIDRRGRVWFATDGKGVDVYDGNSFAHYEQGLPSKVIYGFAEDTLGQLWVNVQGHGIFRFLNDRFVPFDGRVSLRDGDIDALAADNNGNLIAVHDHGIDLLNVSTRKVRFFGEESGIRNRQATLNAVTHDSKGRLYIGTSHGIIKYSPSEIAEWKQPLLHVDRVYAFDQPLDLSRAPVLAYNENNLTIHYLGFWYQNNENLQYLYKMENFDNDWISTANNSVTYSRLPPGDYTLRLRTSENGDFENAPEAAFSFTVRPPFWQTSAFIVASFAFTVVAAWSYLKYRDRKMLEDKVILEQKVEERTLEIQRQKEEIQAQNEEIMAQAEEIKGINENLEMLVKQRTSELEKKNKALEEYAFINAHKLRSPLASILGLINLISKTKLDDEAKVINQHLQQSADELDDVIRSITKAIERGQK